MKMIHRSGRKSQKATAFFLAVLIAMTVLTAAPGFADECPEDGRHIGAIVSMWPVNDHDHAWICGNCGETVTEAHWIYGGYPDPNRFHSVNDQTCYFECGCGYKTYMDHSFYDGVCQLCGYRKGSSTGTSSGSSGKSSGGGTRAINVLPKKPGKNAIPARFRKEGQDHSVLIEILGLCRSYIFVDDVPMFVNTEDLEIAEDVPREQRFAIICVSGHVRVYKEPEFKRSIALCSTGTILPVLSVGENYIQVLFKGKTGYIKRSRVELSPPREGLGTGVIDNGKKSANIRLEKAVNSAKVATVPAGTELTVLSESTYWYEVEYNQQHGYIRKEMMRIKERGFDGAGNPEETSQSASADSTEAEAAPLQPDGEENTETPAELPESVAEEPEEGSLIFRDDRIALSLMNAAAENGTIATKIRATASDCFCYLFAFTSADITEGKTDFYVIKKYVDTMNGTFWDEVSSNLSDLEYRWEENVSYESPFISVYAESMKYDYQTIGCTISDSRVLQPVGFTVIEARRELDMDSLLEGRITLESVSDDLIHTFHLYISPPGQ